jgi:hypothetical protein
LLPQHRHDVIAPDIVLAIVNAAGGIDGDGKVPAVPVPKPTRKLARSVVGSAFHTEIPTIV